MEDLSRRLGHREVVDSTTTWTAKEDLLRLALDRALERGCSPWPTRRRALGRAPRSAGSSSWVRGSIGVLSERLPYVTVLLRGPAAIPRSSGARLARRREFDQIVADLVQAGPRSTATIPPPTLTLE